MDNMNISEMSIPSSGLYGGKICADLEIKTTVDNEEKILLVNAGTPFILFLQRGNLIGIKYENDDRQSKVDHIGFFCNDELEVKGLFLMGILTGDKNLLELQTKVTNPDFERDLLYKKYNNYYELVGNEPEAIEKIEELEMAKSNLTALTFAINIGYTLVAKNENMRVISEKYGLLTNPN